MNKKRTIPINNVKLNPKAFIYFRYYHQLFKTSKFIAT